MLTSTRGRLAFLGLLIVIGYAEWWLAPAPLTSKPVRMGAEPWALPEAPKAQSEKAMTILNTTNLWGKLPEAEAAKSPNDPEWRFVGIATNGLDRFVIIKVEGQPEQRLTINDKLPGGSKILKIESDRICLLINGKTRSLDIYKMDRQVL